MTPEWKLPKCERATIRQRKELLVRRIHDLNLTLLRERGRILMWENELKDRKKELEKLEEEFPGAERRLFYLTPKEKDTMVVESRA